MKHWTLMFFDTKLIVLEQKANKLKKQKILSNVIFQHEHWCWLGLPLSSFSKKIAKESSYIWETRFIKRTKNDEEDVIVKELMKYLFNEREEMKNVEEKIFTT